MLLDELVDGSISEVAVFDSVFVLRRIQIELSVVVVPNIGFVFKQR